MALEPGSQMTLYHCKSARSMRVLWTVHEMGITDKCKLITMPFPPRMFVKEYTRVNVLGTIPYFIDRTEGDVRMTESCGIPQYLVHKYGPTPLQVLPSEADFGAYLNWIAHADATLTFPQTVVLRYTMQEPGKCDKAAADYGKWYIARLRLLDAALADGREFLCAGRFTLADICITFALWLGRMLKLDEKYSPRIQAYLKRMTARPAYLAAVAQEKQSEKDFKAARKAGAKL
eukprot:TRINITY_DN14067_c0_g1_i1.p2 TRINITY_DN14067_c0_g1~~TRINITY_DN14067_c0_g1_i1.p2  ORF type:complete len:260 (+),score=96.78 TRINITY_DN14067_c0_g1_i1:87-782(+)